MAANIGKKYLAKKIAGIFFPHIFVPSTNTNTPEHMNTQATFAADIKEMMNNWNELMRRAAELFPNDTEEERYQRVNQAFTQSIFGANA